jgi:hypothetical protein
LKTDAPTTICFSFGEFFHLSKNTIRSGFRGASITSGGGLPVCFDSADSACVIGASTRSPNKSRAGSYVTTKESGKKPLHWKNPPTISGPLKSGNPNQKRSQKRPGNIVRKIGSLQSTTHQE